jgi:hypothetical protein
MQELLLLGSVKEEPGHPKYIWTQLNAGDVPATKSGVMFSYGTSIYLVTGLLNGAQLPNSQLWKYSVETDTWEQLDCPLVDKVMRTVSVVGHKAYFFGGYPKFKQTWVYDIVANTWSQTVDYPVTVYSASSITKGTDIYIFGGYNDTANGWDNRATRFDTLTNTMFEAGVLPTAMNGGVCTLFNNRYIDYMLGQDSNGNVRQGFRMDTNSQSWAELLSTGMAGTYASCAQTANKAYILFGAQGNTKNNNMTEYNGTTFTPIVKGTPVPGPRSRAAMTRLGDFVYVFGGESSAASNNAIKDFWRMSI